MPSVRRIVIRDGPPIFDPAVMRNPRDRVAIAVAVCSFITQAVALGQAVGGLGNRVGVFDHVSFTVIALTWLLLGITVFLQRAGTVSGRFCLLSAAAGSSYLGLGTLSGVSTLNALLYSTGLVGFAPLMLGFVRSLNARSRWNWIEALIYVPPIALIWPLTSDFVHGRQSFGYRAGILSIGIYLVACVAQAVWNLTRAERDTKAQARAVMFGLALGTIPGVLIFVVPLAVFGRLLVVTTWQPLIALLFITPMSYAALLFEFSTVDLIVRRGIVYGLMTCALIAAYAGLSFALVGGRVTVINPLRDVGFVFLTVLIGAGLQPARRLAHTIVDRSIYGGATDRWQILHDLSVRLSTVMKPAELGDILVRDLQSALHLRGAILFLQDTGGNFVACSTVFRDRVSDKHADRIPVLTGEAVKDALGAAAAPFLLVHSHALLPARRTPIPQEYLAFDLLGAALVFPLATQSGIVGVLCLQAKQSHDEFSTTDLELLVPVIGQSSTALHNALLLSRLEETVTELRGAYTRLTAEQEAERARLARELHDGTAQELAAMITLGTVLERQLKGVDPSALNTLHRMQSQAEDAYQGVRNASHGLRPVMLDGYGLVPALTSFLQSVRERTTLAVNLTVEDIGPLNSDVEWALFRVAQECIENVRKHSGSHCVHVALVAEEGTLVLSIRDHGKGMASGYATGIGMSNMRERLASVGGELRVASSGTGVQVDAVVPRTDEFVHDTNGQDHLEGALGRSKE